MHRGELVPDDLIIDLLLPKVLEAAAGAGYLLDGFPRTVAQAEHAHAVASSTGDVPDAVIYLDVDRAELTRRIVARAHIEGRADDNEETVANRLRVFDEETHPLVEYYRERGLLHVIDAALSEDEVTTAILRRTQGRGLVCAGSAATGAGMVRQRGSQTGEI